MTLNDIKCLQMKAVTVEIKAGVHMGNEVWRISFKYQLLVCNVNKTTLKAQSLSCIVDKFHS